MAVLQTNLRDYNVLVFIPVVIGGETLAHFRWCLAHRTETVLGADDADHDGVWTGLLSLPGFRQSLGSLKKGNTVFPSVSLEATRGPGTGGLDDETVGDIRGYDYLVSQKVYFHLISSTDPKPSESNRFHTGVIERGDVEIDRYRVRITCRDRMEREDRRIPRTLFGDKFPVEERQWNKPTPILIGDWGAETSDYWIRATCVNTDNAQKALEAQLCRPGEAGIISFGYKARWVDSDGRFKRDERGFRDFDIDVTNAEGGVFELRGTDYSTIERRWEEGDQITVKRPRGEADALGSLITSPVDVIRHLLLDKRIGMGLEEADLDTDSFTAVGEIIDDSGYRCRRIIREETTVLREISQICHEFGMKLIVRDGRYSLIHVGWNEHYGEPAHTLKAGQILNWREWNDRMRAGSEGLSINYRYRPEGESFTRNLSYPTEPGDGLEYQTLDAFWLYDDESVTIRASHFTLTYGGGVIRTLHIEADFEGLPVKLGDFVRLEWPEGSGVFQVVEINYRFDLPIGLDIELQALNTPARVGVWSAGTGEAVPDDRGGGTMPSGWDEATDQQKKGLSFWVDNLGKNPDGSPGKVWGR